MRPCDLYEMEPERRDMDTGVLFGCYYNHVPELDGGLDHTRNSRVEIRYLKDFDFDARRFWRLATVWLDDRPVMVIQNAGREGDDYRRAIVTDGAAYREMVGYLASLMPPEPDREPDAEHLHVAPDAEVPGLTEFYGNRLDGYFERYR